jgi:hypothetical protein
LSHRQPLSVLSQSLRRSQYTWCRLGCDAGCPHSIQFPK